MDDYSGRVTVQRRLWTRVRHGAAFPAPALRWPRELLIVAVIYISYEASRGVADSDPGPAMRTGRSLLDWETTWHLDPERWLNHVIRHSTFLEVVAAYFYSTMHYIVTPAVLLWMFLKHAPHYRMARTTLALSTVIGLVGFYFLPTAPPRLLAGSGFTDTLASVADYGWWSNHGSVPRGLGGLSNQFAAMPSLHVGWALWCGIALWTHARTPVVRWLGAAYPLLTTVVVLSTGNHYLLDVLAGAATMGLAGAIAWVLHRRAPSAHLAATGLAGGGAAPADGAPATASAARSHCAA
ncbi:MAG: phosphatase PAP2 family protein [Jatrophihabitans sp.]|uniref:phosphatase PAP2 family protein n=1 Tax=Jatrophihabitans sp. TaxID=1932789 RepID=UPI003F7DC10C